jgi:hypothetical protein
MATSFAVHFDISLTIGASITEPGTHFYGGNVGEDFYRCVDGSGPTQRSYLQEMFSIYRVSIKSFSNYKHLLQTNHVKYKHIVLSSVLMRCKKNFLSYI